MPLDKRTRRARAATTVIFLATGAVFAAWAARIPAVQDRLDLSAGELALAIAGLEGGAVVGLPLGGALVTRLGSRASLRAGFAVYPPALVAVAVAPGLAALAAALAAMAAANSVVDVAMNAQGIELERRYGRPVLSALHAGHAFGVLGGALAGTAAAAAGVPLAAHFGAAATLGAVAGVGATWLLVDEARARAGPLLARPGGRLAALAAIAFVAFLVDGTANGWSAVHLRTEHGASPGLAAAAFAAFAGAVAVARLAGDHLVARLGRRRTVRAGALLAAAGIAAAVAAPGPLLALAGWALVGAGVAPIAPAVLGAAPGASELAAPVAIAAVTTVGYLGSFSGPPAVGALAELAGLPAALLVVLAACLAASLIRAWPAPATPASAAPTRRR